MRITFNYILLLILLVATPKIYASSIDFVVTNQQGEKVKKAYLFCASNGLEWEVKNGEIKIDSLPVGKYNFIVSADFYKDQIVVVHLTAQRNEKIWVKLKASETLSQDTIVLRKSNLSHFEQTSELGVMASKKSELTVLDDIDANKATGNPDQLFYKSPGINSTKTDDAGLQLNIGGRGLDPHRSSNFLVRQNGYDISADALGYPESYYTPPAEAIEKIEVIRGAASLQYGTQFGGLVNFKLRSGFDKKFQIVSRQTGGSFGFFNSFNSVGGTTQKGIKYYAYLQTKRGNGYRSNAEFFQGNLYGHVSIPISPIFFVGIDQTYMRYLAHQPGGLTDSQFEKDPRQSSRERNWFEVKWYVPALTLNYYPKPNLAISSKFFGLIGSRNSVGNLGPVNRVDDITSERDIILGDFKNVGNETRILLDYNLKNHENHLATGFRYYTSTSQTVQGFGTIASDPDFNLSGVDNLKSDYENQNQNFSLFAENIFHITKKLSLTPGARFEYIQTGTDGYFRNRQTDLAGNDIQNFTVNESRELPRSFVIAGIGASYKLKDSVKVAEFYANATQNYRSVTFSDLRINNPSFLIDTNITDEQGYNLDLGFRAENPGHFDLDISGFVLSYDQRIGEILKRVDDPILITTTKRFRTNISDALIYGLEIFIEGDAIKLFSDSSQHKLNLFANTALIRSEYINSEDPSIDGNQLEYAPSLNTKLGVQYNYKNISGSLQYTHVSEQFSDASNAESHPTAVFGTIPAYSLLDLSVSLNIDSHFKIEANINNLTNTQYFSKRASGYPGPGILPAAGRSFYLTLQYKL